MTSKYKRKYIICESSYITIAVTIASRTHLFSFRTQKLSSIALKVLGWTRPGRIGSCRIFYCLNHCGFVNLLALETLRNTVLKPLKNTKSIIFGLCLVLLVFETLSKINQPCDKGCYFLTAFASLVLLASNVLNVATNRLIFN